MRRPVLTCLAAAIVLTLGAGCASGRVQPWEYAPRPMADTLAIWEPAERVVPIVYDATHNFVIDPTIDFLNVPGYFVDTPPALNADRMDEVVNSTWFINRNGVDPLTPDEVLQGAHTGTGPDDEAGPITVTDNKSEGINVGFWIEDAAGQNWLLKLDPPEIPEMASGADVLATNLVWSAGYYTPENYIYYFDPDELVLADGVELDVVEDGVVVNYEVAHDEPDEQELTMELFHRFLLDNYPREPDGTIRALASKFLPGTPKGPFSWEGRRPDDPNDVVPHDHRRELRGYYVIAAWLNQSDNKQGNSLDMFMLDEDSPEDEEEGRRFGHLVHYFLDNGSALGSGGAHPQTPRHGSENELDLKAIGKRLFTLGLYERPWQDVPVTDEIEAIGSYRVDIFEPGNWKPNIPNPTFDNVGPRDGYWGAKIVMSFTDPQLERAIDATQWSSDAARAYILRGLKERRDKTGRYWFAQVSPLDDPRVEDGAVVVFDDLWIRHFGGTPEYRVEFEWTLPEPELELEGVFREPRITLPIPTGMVPVTEADDPSDRYALLKVWNRQEDGDWAPRPALFWLEWSGDAYRIIGARY